MREAAVTTTDAAHWAVSPCSIPQKGGRGGYLKSGVIQGQCHGLSRTSHLSPKTTYKEVREGAEGRATETSTTMCSCSITLTHLLLSKTVQHRNDPRNSSNKSS